MGQRVGPGPGPVPPGSGRLCKEWRMILHSSSCVTAAQFWQSGCLMKYFGVLQAVASQWTDRYWPDFFDT